MRFTKNILFISMFILTSIVAFTYLACKKDKCNNVVCLNGGACNSGNCICPTGYEGYNCSTLSRAKFVTTFNGSDTCSGVGNSIATYAIELLAVTTNDLQMTIYNFRNNIHDSAVCTIVSTDSFTFRGSNNSITYYGGGRLSNDSLWLTFHEQQDTIPYNCTFLGLRQ